MLVFLANVNQRERPTVEVDEYVPVTLTWPGYLRLSDSPNSVMLDAGSCLLEMKVDRYSRELVELVIVDVRRTDLIRESVPLESPIFESGIPCLEFRDTEGRSTSLLKSRLYFDGLDVLLAAEEVVRWVGDPCCVMGFSASDRLARVLIRLDPVDASLAFG